MTDLQQSDGHRGVLVVVVWCETCLAVAHLDNCYWKIADKKADKDDKNHLEQPPVFL